MPQMSCASVNPPEGLHKPLQSAKLTIHEPDSNHIGGQHFRYDLVKSNELEAAVKTEARHAKLPFYF